MREGAGFLRPLLQRSEVRPDRGAHGKRPEFSSLATPLAVRGGFDDFRIGLEGGALSLGTTAAKFAVSPITAPFERLIKEDLPGC